MIGHFSYNWGKYYKWNERSAYTYSQLRATTIKECFNIWRLTYRYHFVTKSKSLFSHKMINKTDGLLHISLYSSFLEIDIIKINKKCRIKFWLQYIFFVIVTINFYRTKSICHCHLKTYTDWIEMTKKIFIKKWFHIVF